MKQLEYNGFGNTPSSCEYGIGKLGEKIALVFYERASHGTSITNMIEALTAHILATDLQGHSADQIRVFEHYDLSMKPLVEWQEVIFRDVGKVNKKSIVEKLIALVIPNTKPPTWYVDGPSWKPVDPQDVAIISGIK